MGDKIKVQQLDRAIEKLLLSLFKGNSKSARFGETGYILSIDYKNEVDNFKNMTVRSDDVFVATFPRSGTTRTQELVWLLKNDLDYDTAQKIPLTERYVYIAFSQLGVPDQVKRAPLTRVSYGVIDNAPAPRFIKTHLPFSLLPKNLLDTTKVVYMARDPRDVIVSYYHLIQLQYNYEGDFKTLWNLFMNDLVTFTPYFPHVKEAWTLRNHPNLLFMFYEDMTMDLPSSIKRIANFLGKKLTGEQVMKLCEHLDINNFKKNESVNPSWRAVINNPAKIDNVGACDFVRKGKVGGWREYFDTEMDAQAQVWLRENLAGTDLRFPGHS